jgi:DNA-binding XRE family transcriptional regulator
MEHNAIGGNNQKVRSKDMSEISDPGPARWPLLHLRDWRLYRGFSQVELAERSGVALSTIALLEIDEPYPDYDHSAEAIIMVKLANALSITRQQLLYESPQ